jgi:hypothetical protein
MLLVGFGFDTLSLMWSIDCLGRPDSQLKSRPHTFCDITLRVSNIQEVVMSDSFETRSPLPYEVQQHYAGGYESQRLFGGSGQIELVRTQELVVR